MLHSTGSHQIRLLLYVCESRILLSVISVVMCYMCIYVHIKARHTVNISSVYNDSEPIATYVFQCTVRMSIV